MSIFEIRIPAMPDASFYSNIKLACFSLARLGADYERVSVSLGGAASLDQITEANRWAEDFPGLSWHPVPPDQADDPFASGFDRFLRRPTRDVIVLADADLCFLDRIDPLLERLRKSQAPVVAGLTAHVPPHDLRNDPAGNDALWRAFLIANGIRNPVLDHSYSQLDRHQHGSVPPYFNFGFIAMNRAAFARIAPLMEPLTRKLSGQRTGPFKRVYSAQLALMLAILRTGCETIGLGPEYNCPNSDEMLVHGLGDAGDIRILHYLRHDLVDRHLFLSDQAAFDTFREARFDSTVLQRFQSHVCSFDDVFYDPG